MWWQQNVDNFQKSADENIVKYSVLMAKCEETWCANYTPHL